MYLIHCKVYSTVYQKSPIAFFSENWEWPMDEATFCHCMYTLSNCDHCYARLYSPLLWVVLREDGGSSWPGSPLEILFCGLVVHIDGYNIILWSGSCIIASVVATLMINAGYYSNHSSLVQNNYVIIIHERRLYH